MRESVKEEGNKQQNENRNIGNKRKYNKIQKKMNKWNKHQELNESRNMGWKRKEIEEGNKENMNKWNERKELKV